ncbi:MAG: bifunctional UDP-N-acetylmuramoyl-tripeptide:D-alanyl-D-alanine ligase/alanine racemase [Bacteroidia bacterium]
MSYTAFSIAPLINGRLLSSDDESNILHLLTDSRKATQPESSLFFALISERNDGHKYIEELYSKGVRNFVIGLHYSFPVLLKGCTVIAVSDTLAALQQLAAYHRSKFSLPVAGITGSNGKTIVKEWLYQLLKDEYNVVRSPKSFNSQIGVPLSVWQIRPEHGMALFEAGISRQGEMQKLAEIIRPNIGVFTNLGNAHSEGFSSQEEKLNEKFKLFADCDVLIYSKDDTAVKNIAHEFFELYPMTKGISWSLHDRATITANKIEKDERGTSISFEYRATTFTFRIPFTDDASIHNALTCVCFLLAVERLSPELLQKFNTLHAVEMRLQLREGSRNCTIINDTYNSDIQSLKIALDFLNQQNQHQQKTVILSDILESGSNQDDLYRKVAEMIEQASVNRVIGVGKDICQQFQKFSINKKFFFNTAHFLENFNSFTFQDEIILIKGARSFEFEKITRLLENKIHATVMEINLNALVNNLNVYRNSLYPGTRVMAMVKAFSYGSGSHEIAKTLEYHRVDYLTVAYADEGVVLRKAGVKTPIMVMNPEPGSFLNLAEYNLEPEIYNRYILDDLLNHVEGGETGIHLELDTGMRRLGFDEQELDALLAVLKKNPNLIVKSVFSHLAASDENKHDLFTWEQIEKFEQMSSYLIHSLGYPVLRHILNSSGITRFPEAQFDMVRLGIGLYGVDPSAKFQPQLENVGSLKTIISQLRKIKAGESVGYSRKGQVKEDATIAVVAIGYADGLDRGLSNGNGHMLVNGKPAPIVGNICMDMTMLDVSRIDCKEGDEVLVFGKDLPITELAKNIDTIPYEILTGISQRVRRVYFQE